MFIVSFDNIHRLSKTKRAFVLLKGLSKVNFALKVPDTFSFREDLLFLFPRSIRFISSKRFKFVKFDCAAIS